MICSYLMNVCVVVVTPVNGGLSGGFAQVKHKFKQSSS